MRISRLDFFESISNIDYPLMLVEFFDHFIALKQIVEDYGRVAVLECNDKTITFSIKFDTTKNRDVAIANAQYGTIVIYGKPISVNMEVISDTEIRFKLQ